MTDLQNELKEFISKIDWNKLEYNIGQQCLTYEVSKEFRLPSVNITDGYIEKNFNENSDILDVYFPIRDLDSDYFYNYDTECETTSYTMYFNTTKSCIIHTSNGFRYMLELEIEYIDNNNLEPFRRDNFYAAWDGNNWTTKVDIEQLDED